MCINIITNNIHYTKKKTIQSKLAFVCAHISYLVKKHPLNLGCLKMWRQNATILAEAGEGYVFLLS